MWMKRIGISSFTPRCNDNPTGISTFMSGLWSLTPVYHQKEQGPLWEMADGEPPQSISVLWRWLLGSVSWKNAQPKSRKGLRGSGTCLPEIRKTLKDYGVQVRNRSDDVTNSISIMSLNSSVPLWNCFPMWAMGMPFPPGWVLGGIKHIKSFPGGPVVNNLPAVRETWVWSLGQKDYPGEGNGNPLQDSCLENPMDRGRSLAGYSPWGHRVGHSLATKQQQKDS